MLDVVPEAFRKAIGNIHYPLISYGCSPLVVDRQYFEINLSRAGLYPIHDKVGCKVVCLEVGGALWLAVNLNLERVREVSAVSDGIVD
jgi:hypothetical protein